MEITMRNPLVIATLLAFAAASAVAQAQIPAPTGPATPEATAPAKGTFKESEAKSRIEKQGFSNVTGLRQDPDGVWRGRAMKGGQQLEVALDDLGNVLSGSAAVGTTAPTDRMPGAIPGAGR